MAAKEVAPEVEFKNGELVYWRGGPIPAGWKHLKKYDDVIVAWDSVDEELEALDAHRPTYRDVGIKVITKTRR